MPARRHERRSRPASFRLCVALLAALLALSACGADDENDSGAATTATAPPSTTEGGERLARTDGDPRVETVATGLEVPWGIAFLPDGDALVTERPGRVRLLDAAGELRGEPVARIDVAAQGEGGLLGLALDPQFEDNRFVYLYFTTPDGMRLARYRFEDGRLSEDGVILGEIQAGPIHDSGRIAFGPDERLYIATGDAGRPQLAQDPDSRNGKFLRMTPEQYRGDGGEAEIFSLGHRNPQGLDWEPGSGRLVATEHGPTGDDEINAIREGRNYGWPRVTGTDHGDFAAPLVVYRETIAPSGATFVTQPGSAWTGDLLVAALRGEQLRRVALEGDGDRGEPLFEGRFGRLRTVAEAPDGSLYVLTSNRDGRGDPVAEDDRILRIVPPRG
ncbi:MAG: PQQ-dependent sugar dehydrogenase [Actinobacteria bacterium]|nr:PQQ-dependent sugar dehydrogenase [Actinomycetota bacterium]